MPPPPPGSAHPPHGPSGQPKAAQEEIDLDKVLEQLNINAGSTENIGYRYESRPSSPPPQRDLPAGKSVGAAIDPRVYLRAPSQSKPHLDICDYVNLTHPVHIEVADTSDTMSIFDQIVKAKTGPKKPRLEDVSIAEWGIANTRIMFELFEPGDKGVVYYWAYTIKMLEMFSKFDRIRVLELDREYRMRQAASQFTWGEDLPHSSVMSLGFGSPASRQGMRGGSSQVNGNTGGQSYGNRRGGRAGDQSGPKPVCNMYNQIAGCRYGQKCNFMHVCDSCRGKHPAFTHHNYPSSTGHGMAQPAPPMAGSASSHGAAAQQGSQHGTQMFVPRH